MGFFGKLGMAIVTATTTYEGLKYCWGKKSEEVSSSEDTVESLKLQVKELQAKVDQLTSPEFTPEAMVELALKSKVVESTSPVEHPGALILKMLENMGHSKEDLVWALDYPKATLARVLNGSSRITANLAIRLEKIGMGTALGWLIHQNAYDTYEAQRNYTFDNCIRISYLNIPAAEKTS